jgi:hypothetical protein
MVQPTSMDVAEITDKGYVNKRGSWLVVPRR